MSPDTVVDVAVVGAGVQGILTACRLKGKGLSVIVLDKHHDLGGVWQNWANESSRLQAPAPMYPLGDRPAEEDWTTRANVLAQLRTCVTEAGIQDRFLHGRAAVKVHDEEGAPYVRLLHRATGSTSEQPVEELRAGNVIFCAGGLQRSREVPLQGETTFGGPIIYGISGKVDRLDFRGKRVVIIGMGAFGIENMRTALFAGASQVDFVAHTKTLIVPRIAAGVLVPADLSTKFFGRWKDYHKSRAPASKAAPQQKQEPKQGPDDFLLKLYRFAGVEDACPGGGIGLAPNTTVPTCSDIFYIAGRLGKMKVHIGDVDHLEPGAAVLRDGGRLEADIIIKNPGFHYPDAENLIGGICEVSGCSAGTYRPPIWITPRVTLFRTEHPPFKPSVMKRVYGGEVYNILPSAPFFAEIWFTLYWHFRQHPDQLKELLANDKMPEVAISEGDLLDVSEGLDAALAMDEQLRSKMAGMKPAVLKGFYKRYAPQGTPKAMQHMAMIAGFTKENIEYWEDCCEKISGDRHAVPYIGTLFLGGGDDKAKKESKRPAGESAL